MDWEEVYFKSIISSGLVIVACCVQKVWMYWELI